MTFCQRIVLHNQYRWDYGMKSVTVSSKFQVVIPKEAREALGLKPGQQVQVFPFDGGLQMVPVSPQGEMKGFLAGIDTAVPRENDRI